MFLSLSSGLKIIEWTFFFRVNNYHWRRYSFSFKTDKIIIMFFLRKGENIEGSHKILILNTIIFPWFLYFEQKIKKLQKNS